MAMLHKITIRIKPELCWLMAALILTIPVKWLFGWYTAVLIHEIGHMIALECCKAPVDSITFGISGAFMQTRELADIEMLLCASAGPIVGILPIFLAKWFPVTAICSLILTVFNLLPILGHDGEKILHGICSLVWDNKHADTIERRIQTGILAVIGCAIILGLFL